MLLDKEAFELVQKFTEKDAKIIYFNGTQHTEYTVTMYSPSSKNLTFLRVFRLGIKYEISVDCTVNTKELDTFILPGHFAIA